MKRGKKLLLLVAALAVAVGLWMLLLNHNTKVEEQGEAQAAADLEATVILRVDPDQVQTLSWTYNGEAVTIARTDTGWMCPDADYLELNSSLIQEMLDQLATVYSTAAFDRDTELADFGLAEPAVEITAVMADGTKALCAIGDENRGSYDYYCCVNGQSDRLYTVDETLYKAFKYQLETLLVSESIPRVENPTAFTVSFEGHTLKVVGLDEGQRSGLYYTQDYRYYLADADGSMLPLSATKVMQAYYNVTDLEWKSCVDADGSGHLGDYGLDHPSMTAVLDCSDGSTVTLLIGDYAASTTQYAMLKGSRIVYTIASDVADALYVLSYESLRADDICLMDWATVDSIDFLFGGEAHTLAVTHGSEGDSYTLDGKTVDAADAEGVLKDINSLTYYDDAAPGVPGRNETMTVTFHRNTGDDYAEMTMVFYDYTSKFVRCAFAGTDNKLLSRDGINNLQSAVLALAE